MSKKVQEIRLQCCGHVFRRDEEYVGKIVKAMGCRGKEGRENQSGCGWITSRKTCRRKRKTEVNGGVS